MTISILKLDAGQKIARPFNRADSHEEIAEMLGWWQATTEGATWKARTAFAAFTRQHFVKANLYKMGNLDTETPIFEYKGIKFFAFTE